MLKKWMAALLCAVLLCAAFSALAEEIEWLFGLDEALEVTESESETEEAFEEDAAAPEIDVPASEEEESIPLGDEEAPEDEGLFPDLALPDELTIPETEIEEADTAEEETAAGEATPSEAAKPVREEADSDDDFESVIDVSEYEDKAVEKLTFKATYAEQVRADAVLLKWEKAPGAASYEVTCVVGGEVKRGAVTGCSLTMGSLPEGDYAFTIRPCSEKREKHRSRSIFRLRSPRRSATGAGRLRRS